MFGSQPVTHGSNRSDKNTCRSFSAFFKVLPDRRIRIFFLKRGLTPTVIRYYFGNGQFIMPSAFDLPTELAKSLGIDFYRIQSGVYTIKEDNEYIMVDV